MGEEIGTGGLGGKISLTLPIGSPKRLSSREVSSPTTAFLDRVTCSSFEIECWILNRNYFPSSINQRLLETLAHPLVVPELSRFNVELNCEPLLITTGNVLDRTAMALSRLWAECNAVAHTLDANLVMIGTLPTIRDEDLTLANMSPLNRFYALNREVLRQCRGRALRVDILGREHLISEHRDLMLEAATTSFQIHLKTPAYNASVTGDRRFRGERGVSMGSGYLTASCLEVFEENSRECPVLLRRPPATLRHLRLHNGAIWRWNRPLIFDPNGVPHLRIEHRVLPAGPTICDMIANVALYLGLARYVALSGGDGTGGLPYADAF